MQVTITSLPDEGFRQAITAANQTFFSDLGTEKGGTETAPDPHQMFLASWGACTNMTLMLYARKKGWPLTGVVTCLSEEKQGSRSQIHKRIEIRGELDDAQVSRLKEVAEKCPVHQLIVGEKQITSEMAHLGN